MRKNNWWGIVLASSVVFCSGVCYGGALEEAVDTLPLIEGAHKADDLNEDLMVNGAQVIMRHYRAPRSLAEIERFYRETLPRQGWKMDDSNVQASAHSMMSFSKRGIYLYVVGEVDLNAMYHHMVNRSLAPLSFYLRQQDTSAESAEDDIYFCFTEKQIEICKTLGIVEFEMPGNDPDQVPVYPGAVRKTSIERLTEGGGFFVYETSADIAAIREFYKFKMQFFGWETERSEPLSEELVAARYGFVPDRNTGPYARVEGYFLSFKRSGEERTVDVVITQRGFLDSRLINIYY